LQGDGQQIEVYEEESRLAVVLVLMSSGGARMRREREEAQQWHEKTGVRSSAASPEVE
jgi:hypothetical protein